MLREECQDCLKLHSDCNGVESDDPSRWQREGILACFIPPPEPKRNFRESPADTLAD